MTAKEQMKKMQEEAIKKLMMPPKILKAETFLEKYLIPKFDEAQKLSDGECGQIMEYIYEDDNLGIFSFEDAKSAVELAEKHGLTAKVVNKENGNYYCVFARLYG